MCIRNREITLPDGIVNLGYGAFEECSSLKSINIPQGITTIESNVFSGCSSLENINIPDNVTSIKENAFRGCSSLKDSSIKLSDNITEIGNYAFSGCALKNFVLPETVIDVGDGLFYGCWDLRSVKLPENKMCIRDRERGQLDHITPDLWQNDTSVAKNSWGYTIGNDYKKPSDVVPVSYTHLNHQRYE